MKNRSLALGAAAAVLLALTACSTDPAAEDAGSGFGQCSVTGEAGSLTLETAEEGVLTVATVLPNPGWWNGTSPESVDSGFEYCMAATIAHRAGFESFELKNLAWDQYISGTASGYDFAIAGTTITDERKEVFDFSEPYFSSNLGVATKADADVTAENIRDKKIGVLQGNMGAAFVVDTIKPDTAPAIFQSQNDMFTALSAGTVDAVVTDATLALTSTQASNGTLVVIGQYELDQGYGVVTPLGSANTAAIGTVVGELAADGTLATLSEEYLQPLFGIDPSSLPVWKLS